MTRAQRHIRDAEKLKSKHTSELRAALQLHVEDGKLRGELAAPRLRFQTRVPRDQTSKRASGAQRLIDPD
jgi:hypothetical protein